MPVDYSLFDRSRVSKQPNRLSHLCRTITGYPAGQSIASAQRLTLGEPPVHRTTWTFGSDFLRADTPASVTRVWSR